MDLFDITEMLADWISYKEDITFDESVKIIEQQAKRFGLSDELKEILLNTLKRYFIITEEERKEKIFSESLHPGKPDIVALTKYFGN